MWNGPAAESHPKACAAVDGLEFTNAISLPGHGRGARAPPSSPNLSLLTLKTVELGPQFLFRPCKKMIHKRVKLSTSSNIEHEIDLIVSSWLIWSIILLDA